METIIGYDNLKDEYLKAKLECGDFRGLSNKFELAQKFNINPLQIYFNSCTSTDLRFEMIPEIAYEENENGFCEYNMKNFFRELKFEDRNTFYITFTCLKWNKYRTDADRKTIKEFCFKKNAE